MNNSKSEAVSDRPLRELRSSDGTACRWDPSCSYSAQVWKHDRWVVAVSDFLLDHADTFRALREQPYVVVKAIAEEPDAVVKAIAEELSTWTASITYAGSDDQRRCAEHLALLVRPLVLAGASVAELCRVYVAKRRTDAS